MRSITLTTEQPVTKCLPPTLTTSPFSIGICRGMTGPEMCKKFSSGRRRQTPILLLTGRHNEDDKEIRARCRRRRLSDEAVQPQGVERANSVAFAPRAQSAPGRGVEGSIGPVSAFCVSCMHFQYSPDDPDSEFCKVDGSATVLISPSRMVGRTVGNIYTIVSLLGMGAWSEVYKATDTVSNTPVALKILHSSMAQDPLKVTRFNREAEALLRLKHRCLAKVYAQSTIDSRPCLVMEYLEGGELGQHIWLCVGDSACPRQRQFFCRSVRSPASAHAKGLIPPRSQTKQRLSGRARPGFWSRKCWILVWQKSKRPKGGLLSSTLTGTGEVHGNACVHAARSSVWGNWWDGRSDQYSSSVVCSTKLSQGIVRAIPVTDRRSRGQRCLSNWDAIRTR